MAGNFNPNQRPLHSRYKCTSKICPGLTFGKTYRVHPYLGTFWDDNRTAKDVKQCKHLMEAI